MHATILLVGLCTVARSAVGLSPRYELEIDDDPYAIVVNRGAKRIVSNIAVLVGASNNSVSAVDGTSEDTKVSAKLITESIVQVSVSTELGYIGARFSAEDDAKHYGVWAYPWNNSVQNHDIAFDLKGLQRNRGISYSSARSPYFISSTGYAVYAETKQMGSYNFNTTANEIQFIFNTTHLDYYIILPNNDEAAIKSLLTQYAGLTDPSALWSPTGYGPMFWHDDWTRTAWWPQGINSSQEFVQKTVDELYYNKIRASGIMVDRPYGTGTEGWGNWDFDPKFWWDARALIANVSDYGMDFQIWIANRAVQNSALYNGSVDNGWLFLEMVTEEDTSIALNLSIPEAYEFFKAGMSTFIDMGIKGYKIDRGEEDEMPSWEQNIQSYLYHKLNYEGQAEKWGGHSGAKPAGFYTFARSVLDKSRKYTGVWNGDPEATPEGLSYSVASGIRAGLLGFPMWGCDCGGYNARSRTTDKIFARWMWFSTFTPSYELMMYPGSTPWYDYSDEIVGILAQSAELHHQLIPFIQSYMYSATKDGLPIIRALFIEESDPATWDINDSYFFGEEFLVAPITTVDGPRSVYFPTGGKYLEYFNKTEIYNGGDTITAALNVSSIPVYVREGSVFPIGDIYRFNNHWDENWESYLNIEAYPSYTVPRKSFTYFHEKEGKTAKILLKTKISMKQVCVTYGRLGEKGTVKVFLKGGVKTAELKPSGGTACFRDVETLFD